jgi:hypothetical protein
MAALHMRNVKSVEEREEREKAKESKVGERTRPDVPVVGVIVETAAHFEQLADGDFVAVGHARDVLGHRIIEFKESKLALLSQLHDHCCRHGLGVRGYPEVGVGAGRVRGVQLGGAAGGGEVTLRCAQENHGAGDEKLLDGRVHQSLQCCLVDRLETRCSLR